MRIRQDIHGDVLRQITDRRFRKYEVLLLNGSSNLKGCTYTALEEIAKTLQEEGIDTEIFQIGAEPLRDCIGCGGCRKGNGCVFRDDCVNEFVEKAKEADGFVFGSPVHYASASGMITSFLDRVFYGLMHRYVEPGARARLQDFLCRRRRFYYVYRSIFYSIGLLRRRP